MKDSYSATWLSFSSIGDYLKCPRLYFLRNVYKDKKTGHKITVMIPPLALGQVVHDVVESLSVLPVEERLNTSLFEKYDASWKKVSGELGGFKDAEQEARFKERGRIMLQRIIDNPGPIAEKAVKIKQNLPHYWLSEEENIILCGKIDWLRYRSDDTIDIIDFKTGKNDEDETSLQLPIYLLLVDNCQSRVLKGAYYWYLDRDDSPREVTLPDYDTAENKVMEICRKVALARKLNHLVCKDGGCSFCEPLERVCRGEGKLVGESEYKQDIYVL